jgi:LmeA-like phospholipid-binding
VISSVLSSACAAWLRTQVSAVAELQVKIVAGDRQMLAGVIPQVAVAAQQIVYRGIAIQKIELLAEQIATNLKQVIRGKPLQLLQPIMITIDALMTSTNLHNSLSAPFFNKAITDLVRQILATADPNWSIQWQSATIQANQVLLQGQVEQSPGQQSPISIQTGIELVTGQVLRLAPLTVTCTLELPGSDLDSYEIDLGDQVNLKKLTLQEGELLCNGEIQVNP